MKKREERQIERRLRLFELPLLIGLVLTWMALWREISLLSVVSGIIVAMVITRVFYLPPVKLAGRFNPWFALRYLAYFLKNLTVASFQVAWFAVRPKPTPKCAMIAVELRTHSDFILTMTGITISLIPGSFIVDVDRDRSILYLHVLNTPTYVEIDQMRNEVRHIEMLLIRTVGSTAEVALVT